MREKIFLSSPHMSDEGYEKMYVQEAFDTNWVAPLGKNVNEFEKELSSYVGIKDAAALSSGTSAIHMALIASGVTRGDVVFCQSLTFSASANPIIYQGAIPVFIDSEPDTWNISVKALEKAFEKYPNAKAVIAVNLYGMSAKLDEIKALCEKYNAVLIEDAAESLGTTYKNKFTGTYGDYGIFSFNGNKIITTSGGGMLVSNNEERIKKVRFWSTQARDQARHYQHSEIGYNYRMSNVVAGIGRGQLRVLEQRVEKKRYIYNYYKEALKEIVDIEFMPIHDEIERCNCWLTSIVLNKDSKVKPLDIMVALENENIESRPIWKPMHLQPVFADCDYIDNDGCSEDIFNRGVCLPSDSKMTDEQLQLVVNIIKGLWQ